MPRRYSPYASSFSFGAGPLSTAMKALIGVNVVIFLAQTVVQPLTDTFGLIPASVLGGLQMFGTELERQWGTQYFLKFYFMTGVGAGILTVLFSLLPFEFANQLYQLNVIGASGAIYGLLLAYGLRFPDRPIYLYFLFPIPTKYFVLIMGVIAFYGSIGGAGGVANATHLGGLFVAYLLLKGARVHPVGELKYRYLKWKIDRARKKFGVYSGGRT